MKKIFFIVLSIATISCVGQTIDSVIYIPHSNWNDNHSLQFQYATVDSFSNGQLIDSSTNNLRFRFTYDSLERILNEDIYYLILGSWLINQKTTYSYDSFGNILSKTLQSGNPLQNINRYLYSYNPGPKLSEEIYQEFLGGWQNRSRIEYTYDTNDSIKLEIGSTAFGNNWLHMSTHLHYHDAGNLLSTDTFFLLIRMTGTFDYSTLSVIYRDTALRDTSVSEYLWNNSSHWDIQYQSIYHYDSLTLSYAQLNYGIDHIAGGFQFFGEIDYTYNGANQLTHIFYNDPDICSDNEYFSYDSAGHLQNHWYDHICGTNGSNGWQENYYSVNPSSYIFPVQYLCEGDTVILEYHTPEMGNHYSWIPSAGLNNDTSSAPKCSPDTTTIYQLIVTDTLGNTDTLSTEIIVKSGRHINIVISNVDTISLCNSFKLGIDSGIPIPTTYSWSLNQLTLNSNAATHNDNRNGTYVLSCIFNSGCSTKDSVSINFMPNIPLPAIQRDACNKVLFVNYPGAQFVSWIANGNSLVNNDTLFMQLAYRSYNNYVVEVYDSNGCIIYSLPEQIEYKDVGLLTYRNESCQGLCDGGLRADLSSIIYSPYQFAWSNGDTIICSSCYENTNTSLCSGFNTVTVTDVEGCVLRDSANILSPNSLSISISHVNDSLGTCSGSITFDPNVSDSVNMIYICLNDTLCDWYPSNSLISFTGLCSDTFNVSVYYNGCFSEDQITISNSPTDINEVNHTDLFYILPNPVINDFIIVGSDTYYNNNKRGFLTDISGKIIRKYENIFNRINVSNLDPGIYFLHSENNSKQVFRILKIN